MMTANKTTRSARAFAFAAVLVAATLSAETSQAQSIPDRNGSGGLELSEVLFCYQIVLRALPYDAICDADLNGSVTLGETLVWYGIFTRQLIGLVSADPAVATPGSEVALSVLNVAPGEADLVATLRLAGQSHDLAIAEVAPPIVRVDLPGLVLQGPEPGTITLGRAGQPASNPVGITVEPSGPAAVAPSYLRINSAVVDEHYEGSPFDIGERVVGLSIVLDSLPTCPAPDGRAPTFGFLLDTDDDPTTGLVHASLPGVGADARVSVTCNPDTGNFEAPQGTAVLTEDPDSGKASLDVWTRVRHLPAVEFRWFAYATDRNVMTRVPKAAGGARWSILERAFGGGNRLGL